MILGAFRPLIVLTCRVFKELSEGASVSQLQEGGADQVLIINGNRDLSVVKHRPLEARCRTEDTDSGS